MQVAYQRMIAGRTEQSLIITGLRGVGKTVLLNNFEDLAYENNFIPFYHELTPESDTIQTINNDLASVLIQLQLTERAKKAVQDALSHLVAVTVDLADDISLSLKPGKHSEDILSRDLSELFVKVGELARAKSRGVVFLLDELQFVKREHYRALISALHRAGNQKRLPITMAGAGLPQVPKLSGEARSYAERLFLFKAIGKLDDQAARAALEMPAVAGGVHFDADAVDAAIEWSRSYPFFIQVIGKHAWNVASKSPIKRKDVEVAGKLGQRYLDESFYKVRLQRATPDEMAYMRAMASLGDGPYGAREIISTIGKSHQQLTNVRNNLIVKGLIYPTADHGYSDFTVPMFADYLRRQA